MRPFRVFHFGFFILNVVFEVLSLETNICSPKACLKTDNEKAVCGSDGLSYPNRCQLERARCQNQNVTLVKRGPCKRQRSCLEWETLSLDFPQYRFKARCKKNGAYEPGQCHPETGYCWCVTLEGIPIPYTTKEKNDKPGGKPIRCGGRKKKIRSPTRKTKNKTCKLPDKSLLNNNLVNSFHSEYHREHGRNDSDSMVITWKFKTLDSNNNQALDKIEYKDLKRLVKKAMKPKKCAKTFPKLCDVDSDSIITLQEWGDCLSRDGITDKYGKQQETSETEEVGGDDYEDPPPSPPHGVLNLDSSVLPALNQNYDDDILDTREEETTDCLADRRLALEEGSTHEATYIPECTPDGRYKKVQCYKSAGYCWCVNEDTGKNIPGTSVKGDIPNCNLLRVPQNPMKGCPDEKKFVFLQELVHFLHNRMTESVSSKNPAGSLALIQSREEQAAHWSFNYLDKNKNKMLERPEWKIFKDMVAPIKGLRKCGKKLPRYCDSNKDREISMTEWLDCLNVQVQQGVISSLPNPHISPRTGRKNPLSMLKDD